ncbi:hypothetical protein Hanom_Chr17g01566061 [Helianthus anomalus]
MKKKIIELDWEAILDFWGNESGEVYLDSVMEWLSNLAKNDESDPPRTVTLTGKVSGKPTTMCLASMSQLFLLDKGVAMKRDNLKPLVSALLSLVVSNVAPRLGDMMGVRKWELVVIFALKTGQVHLLFWQLVMLHIWQSRNKRLKKLIPHAQLISAFLRKQGITHVKIKLWHNIKFGDGAKLKVLQWGKQPPSRGEMDDLDSSDEEVLRLRREAGVQGVFGDDTKARVHSSQPPEYVGWKTWQQSLYDQNSRLEINRERKHEEMMRFLGRADRARHMSGEMELNLRAYDENQTQHYHEYYNGVPYCENPPHVDFSQVPPYELGMSHLPMPQVHGSMWLSREYSEPHFQGSYSYQPPLYEYPAQHSQQHATQSSSSQSQQQQGPQGGGLANIST